MTDCNHFPTVGFPIGGSLGPGDTYTWCSRCGIRLSDSRAYADQWSWEWTVNHGGKDQ